MHPLLERIRSIERRHAQCRGDAAPAKPIGVLETGWASVDAAIGGGLTRGGLHEWLGNESAATTSEVRQHARNPWRPPLCVLVHLAWSALDADRAGLWNVWIGRRCFPHPAVLLRGSVGDRTLLERSLFVSPLTPTDRLWAMDLALRSPAVGVVIGDGSEFDMAATRRVQLVAKNHETLALLARPPWEHGELSAAQTRWLVRQESVIHRDRSDSSNPQWRVELLRCKGMRWEQAQGVWNLEWNRAACTLRVSASVADSAGDASVASEPTQRRAMLDRQIA
ncbi:MAG: hypothetical protein AABZ12_12955 [Planctomycetota bacterium]